MVELALATRTTPAYWWAEDDRVIATALTVLEGIREAAEAAAKR